MKNGNIDDLRRIAKAVQQQRDRMVEAVWRAIVGNDTPKKEDGELTIQGTDGPEARYYFRYKGEDVAVLTIKEIVPGQFSWLIQSESITPRDVMKKLKEIEQGERICDKTEPRQAVYPLGFLLY